MPALKLVGAGPRRSKLSVGEIVKLYAGVLLFGTCVCGREDTWNVIMHMHIRARAYRTFSPHMPMHRIPVNSSPFAKDSDSTPSASLEIFGFRVCGLNFELAALAAGVGCREPRAVGDSLGKRLLAEAAVPSRLRLMNSILLPVFQIQLSSRSAAGRGAVALAAHPGPRG